MFRKNEKNKDSLNKKFVFKYESGKYEKWKEDVSLDKKLYSDLIKYGILHLLRYEDRNSMTFSIESRVPFLEYVLVEYIFSLPID